jgi:hypothetical protein
LPVYSKMSASNSRNEGEGQSHTTCPITTSNIDGYASSSDGEDMEEEELDLLVSRSFPVQPMLEIEPFENSLLRGPRRYSVGSGSHRRRSSLAASQHRQSISSEAVAEEGAGNNEADVETPLLKKAGIAATPDTTASTSNNDLSGNNPYLGGVTVAKFWLIFMEIMATYFIACFDGTIMASSHPVITSYFGASNSASWLSTAFLLTSTTFQPLVARFSDSVGRKKPYVFTMAVFLAATVWCALAGSMTSFIIARAVCGFGAGGMMTLGSIIISDLVPIE